jgi:hypothetical protein
MRLTYAKLLIAAFLAAAPTALATTTWYVNGVSGNDANNCLSSSTACKAIGHAISLASSGDSIKVAAATYKENLTIGFSLRIAGSGASSTIIEGYSGGTVVTNTAAQTTLSNVTITGGVAPMGGGVYNSGTLTISHSTLSGNSAKGIPAFGGGIYNKVGTLTIINSTFSVGQVDQNHAAARGFGDRSGRVATPCGKIKMLLSGQLRSLSIRPLAVSGRCVLSSAT